jgi:hypothetical protein
MELEHCKDALERERELSMLGENYEEKIRSRYKARL